MLTELDVWNDLNLRDSKLTKIFIEYPSINLYSSVPDSTIATALLIHGYMAEHK